MRASRAGCLISAIAAIHVWRAALVQGNPFEQGPTTDVTVPFLAVNRHGNPVTGVNPTDISILDDKKQTQRVGALYTGKEAPLRLGLLIDASNSQRVSRVYAPSVQAGFTFVSHVLTGPEDRVFIVPFDTVPKISA